MKFDDWGNDGACWRPLPVTSPSLHHTIASLLPRLSLSIFTHMQTSILTWQHYAMDKKCSMHYMYLWCNKWSWRNGGHIFGQTKEELDLCDIDGEGSSSCVATDKRWNQAWRDPLRSEVWSKMTKSIGRTVYECIHVSMDVCVHASTCMHVCASICV